MASHLIDYILIKMNTMKTEITNLMTNMLKNRISLFGQRKTDQQ